MLLTSSTLSHQGRPETLAERKQGRRSAGMQENDRRIGDETAPDVVDQTMHRLGGVNGIEQDPLFAGEQPEGLEATFRRNAVALADVPLVGLEVLGSKR